MIGRMIMNTKKTLEKSLKSNYLFLGLAIFFFTITIFIGVRYYHIIKEKLENPVDLLDAKASEYSQINIEFLMDDYFAKTESNGVATKKAYIVYDGKYFYIACLNEDAMDKLQYMLDYIYSEEEMQEPEPVLIKGTATYIPDDLKKMAMDSYNEMAGKEVVNEDNFNDYFGAYYLDTYLTPKDNISNCLIICLFPLIMGLVFFSTYQIKKNRLKSF